MVSLFTAVEYNRTSDGSPLTLDTFIANFHNDMINVEDYGYNLLETAVLHNRPDIVRFLLSLDGWDINHKANRGLTVLQFVSMSDHFDLDTALMLLDYGNVDTNVVDRWGNNPLWTSTHSVYLARVTLEQRYQYHKWFIALLDVGFRPNERTIEYAKSMKDHSVSWIHELIA